MEDGKGLWFGRKRTQEDDSRTGINDRMACLPMLHHHRLHSCPGSREANTVGFVVKPGEASTIVQKQDRTMSWGRGDICK